MSEDGPIIMRPLDACVEWLIKGINIGFYYSLFYAKKEVSYSGQSRLQYMMALSGFTTKQCLLFGGILGTWQFITFATANARHIEDPLNYTIGSVFTLLLWHVPLKLPSNKLFQTSMIVGTVGYVLGKMSIDSDN